MGVRGAPLSALALTACLARFEVGAEAEGATNDDAANTETAEGAGEDAEEDADEGNTESADTVDGGCDCDPVLEVCDEGSCVCRPRLTACDGTCVHLDSDPAHCGVCGNGCVATVCEDAECGGSECQEGDLTLCDGACVNTKDHPLHCGGCGAPCPSDAICIDSQCRSYEPSDCTNSDACEGGVCCDEDEFGVICVDGDQCP